MNIEVSNTKCDIFNELESVNYGYIITCHNLLRCIYPLIKYINNKKCCNIEFKLTIYETFMFKIEDCKNGIIFKCYNHVGIDTYRQMLKKFVNYCENDQRSNSIFNSDISIYCLGLAYVKENYLTYIDKDKFSNDFYKILKSNNLNIEFIKHFDLEKDKNNEIMLIEYEKRKKEDLYEDVRYKTECNEISTKINDKTIKKNNTESQILEISAKESNLTLVPIRVKVMKKI